MASERLIPQTPAEQQAVVQDAEDAIIDGDAEHNKRVLGEMYATLRLAAPAVWERILNCPACHGEVTIGHVTKFDYNGQSFEMPLLCPFCHADRLEYAALIGM